MQRLVGGMLVVLTLGGSVAACAGRVRVYDEPRRDYHRWDRNEERAYRAYLEERHRGYVQFVRLNQREQEEYWEWRHSHQDRDRARRR